MVWQMYFNHPTDSLRQEHGCYVYHGMLFRGFMLYMVFSIFTCCTTGDRGGMSQAVDNRCQVL